MNRITAIFAVAFAASVSSAAFAGTGLAGDITIETEPFVGTKSRTEVRADLDAYKKSGVNPWADGYDQLAGFSSSKSRAQVTADYVANREAVAAFNSEDGGSRYIAEGTAARRAVRVAQTAGKQ